MPQTLFWLLMSYWPTSFWLRFKKNISCYQSFMSFHLFCRCLECNLLREIYGHLLFLIHTKKENSQMGRTRTVTNFRSLFRNGQSITSGNPLRLGFKPTDDALMPATGINRPILSFIVNPGRGGGRFRVNVLNGDRLINIVPSTQINDGVMRTFNEIIPGDIFRGQAGNQNIAFEHQGGTIQIRDVIIWYNRKIKV